MSADEKIRVSGETPRSTSPVLPTVNPGLEKSKPSGASIHPTFYVIAWIGFSSSVILFNKWLLDTLNFPIVVGVIIASMGEIHFVTVGVLFQMGGIIFEALRLTMVQRLLSSADYKMDPLVSLYYFAPICAVMNGVVALIWEVPNCTMAEVYHVGLFTFFLNGLCAFMLNVSVVFLIGKTSAVVLTLCGVLKDILLVGASMMIWGTQVSPLQFFGYSIALGGMVYYKLGYEQLKGHIADANRQWADFGARKPVLRKVTVLVATAFLIFTLFGGFAPSYSSEVDPATLANEVSNRFGINDAQHV
ncbi:unnamed protein product [Fusarium graminearum]|nr:unnamed protein product [Fusarium graminearum]